MSSLLIHDNRGVWRAIRAEQLDPVSLGILPGTPVQILRTLIIGGHKAIAHHLLTLAGPLEFVGAAGSTGYCCTADGEVKVHEGVGDGSAREDKLDALGDTCLMILLGPPVTDDSRGTLYGKGTLVCKSLFIR